MNDRAILWQRTGLVWLLLTMGAGMHIGLSGQFGASSHHTHAGLLGGLWSVAFGLLFERRGLPLASAGWIQWAFYNFGVMTMVVALYQVVRHGPPWGMIIGLGGIVVLAATAWIVGSVWPRRA